MKNLATLFLVLTIGFSSFAQAVDDEAIIPVSVTLNSILRLNVTSGGNIEFVFNNINQYKAGIGTNARYDTEFTVASSIDFEVDLTPEDADDFIGTDDPANTMAVSYVLIAIEDVSGGASTVAPAAATPLTVGTATYEIVSYDGTNSNAGDATDNQFAIHWSVAPIIAADLAADRYSNNFFLSLRVPN